MKKITKTLLSITLIASLITAPSVRAAHLLPTPSVQIEYLDNGYYFETVINAAPAQNSISLLSAANTITRTKTSSYKNSNGIVLWSVSITATFTYDGSTSKCNYCYGSASAPSPSWSIQTISASKSGNTATATAIATNSQGNTSSNYTKSITIRCSKNGVIS